MFGQFLSYPFVICVYVGSSERQAISFSQLDNLYVLLNQLQVKRFAKHNQLQVKRFAKHYHSYRVLAKEFYIYCMYNNQ